MKIVYLHSTIWPSNSPSAVFVTYYTSALAETGAEVELIVQQASGNQSAAEVLEDHFGLKPRPNWRISALSVKGAKHNIRRRRFYRKVKERLKAINAEGEPDICITRSLSLLPMLLDSALSAGKSRIFFESHDFFSRFSAVKHRGFQAYKNFFRERIYIPKTHGLICLQKTQSELYRSVYPEIKIIHLPTGCREFDSRTSAKGKFTAVYVGSLDMHKGMGDALDIWRGWQKPPRLLIVGGRSPSEVDSMKEKIKSLALEEHITVIPWQKPAAIPMILQQADVGLLPLQDNFFNRYLTFPLKLMDYLAAGLPVIAKKLPTIESVLQDGVDSILMDELSSAEFRTNLEKLRCDEEFYNNLKQNIIKKGKELSWRRRAELSLDLLS